MSELDKIQDGEFFTCDGNLYQKIVFVSISDWSEHNVVLNWGRMEDFSPQTVDKQV